MLSQNLTSFSRCGCPTSESGFEVRIASARPDCTVAILRLYLSLTCVRGSFRVPKSQAREAETVLMFIWYSMSLVRIFDFMLFSLQPATLDFCTAAQSTARKILQGLFYATLPCAETAAAYFCRFGSASFPPSENIILYVLLYRRVPNFNYYKFVVYQNRYIQYG